MSPIIYLPPRPRDVVRLAADIPQDMQDAYAIDNRFLEWYASYWLSGNTQSVEASGEDGESIDIFLSQRASSRFGLGVSEDGTPVLGVPPEEVGALFAMRWTEAALLRRVKDGGDWLALASDDARVSGNVGVPVTLRLWLPVDIGMFDGWLATAEKPSVIEIVEAVQSTPHRQIAGDKVAILPLGFHGRWSIQPPRKAEA